MISIVGLVDSRLSTHFANERSSIGSPGLPIGATWRLSDDVCTNPMIMNKVCNSTNAFGAIATVVTLSAVMAYGNGGE